MKKIKTMLTVVVILAAVSGALAFKARKFNGFCVYTTTTINSCNVTGVRGFTTTTSDPNPLGGTTSYYALTAQYDNINQVCPGVGSSCSTRYWTKAE
jgi:hypothetical protein